MILESLARELMRDCFGLAFPAKSLHYRFADPAQKSPARTMSSHGHAVTRRGGRAVASPPASQWQRSDPLGLPPRPVGPPAPWGADRARVHSPGRPLPELAIWTAIRRLGRHWLALTTPTLHRRGRVARPQRVGGGLPERGMLAPPRGGAEVEPPAIGCWVLGVGGRGFGVGSLGMGLGGEVGSLGLGLGGWGLGERGKWASSTFPPQSPPRPRQGAEAAARGPSRPIPQNADAKLQLGGTRSGRKQRLGSCNEARCQGGRHAKGAGAMIRPGASAEVGELEKKAGAGWKLVWGKV